MANLSSSKNKIEIIIDGDIFYYQHTDKKIKELKKFEKDNETKLKALQKEVGATKDLGAQLDLMNVELERIYDFLLGEGTYKILYGKSGSAIIMMDLLYDVMGAIKSELSKMQSNQLKEKQRLLAKYQKKN